MLSEMFKADPLVFMIMACFISVVIALMFKSVCNVICVICRGWAPVSATLQSTEEPEDEDEE